MYGLVPVAGGHVDLVLWVFVTVCFGVVVYIVLLSCGVVRSLVCVFVVVLYVVRCEIFRLANASFIYHFVGMYSKCFSRLFTCLYFLAIGIISIAIYMFLYGCHVSSMCCA
jgi:hypothetical protein